MRLAGAVLNFEESPTLEQSESMDMGVASLKIDRLTIEASLLVNQMNNFESFNNKNLRFGQR